LDYMREHEITVQAWSPFQYGHFQGVFVDNDSFPKLNSALEEVANKYGVSKTTISVAWINSHPAKIQTVVGTMTPSRIIECAKAADIILTKDEWYKIYLAAGNVLI
ncbi:MAG: aldo/keto reductase, partial [Acholeplasma sp.]|nr:aldo/keto reductase [Acholeplasma sp.]